MADLAGTIEDFGGRSLRLDTLVRLRWLAVVGQLAAVLVVHFGLGFPLPIELCLGLIGVSAALNIVFRLRYPSSFRLGAVSGSLNLAYDVLQLAGLLFLTGGLDNPFSFLLIVPMIVSATTLAPRSTLMLGVLVVAAASLIGIAHWPLPWFPDRALDIPTIYTAGVWVALFATCAFTGIYTFRVADEARQLARALYATEMVLAREQHLSALDGLAAAAAHELGTPLATIALVAKELEREAGGGPHGDDIALLRSQAQRCRDILGKLTSLSSEGDSHIARQPLSHLIEEVVEPYRAFAANIVILPPAGSGPEPVGRRNPAVMQSVVNLVENAVDFASDRVEIATRWDASEVELSIADDGPGYSASVLARLGEPYLTTRARGGEESRQGGGLGLGLFIAKTLLERTGARISFGNRPAPATGAVVRIVWPRRMIDLPQESAGGLIP